MKAHESTAPSLLPPSAPEAPTIAQVALPAAVDRVFDYRIPATFALVPGSLVKVTFARRPYVGVVVGLSIHSDVDAAKLMSIDAALPLPPLPDDIRHLLSFACDYYQSPVGLTYALAVPPLSAQPTPPKNAAQPLWLTAFGRTQLSAKFADLGQRPAPALRALWAQVADAGSVSVEQQKDSSATHKKYLREWREAGWLSTSPVDSDRNESVKRTAETTAPPQLHPEQRAAVDAVTAALGRFQPFLLQGITGSGKTEVYLSLARHLIAEGKQVLILLPEIHLTPQFLARVQRLLPGVDTAVLHSALPDGERLYHWQRAAQGQAQLVLGTRLALFTPLPRLALIVVDEEHDASFKQQDGARYHARDLAVWRARARDVPIVLGSATPSLESYHHANTGRYQHLRIQQRADPLATLPQLRLVPAQGDDVREGIAPALWAALKTRLERREQSLIFINRRGFSPSLKCNACSWEAECPQCAVRLVLHKQPLSLRCHHCGYTTRVPASCPSCGNLDLLPRGHGTQRLETALAQAFPEARIARIDRDSTRRRNAFSALHAQVANQEIDILIGTQMLAKGHDFPRVTLVGVLGADNALYSADFRATERLSALLHQVAGRAGRGAIAGEVIVQTDFAQHPLYETLVAHDYDSFARSLLEERRAALLPPFAALTLLAAEARDESQLNAFLRQAHTDALNICAPNAPQDNAVRVYAPVPATLTRRAGHHRAQIVVQSHDRRALHLFLSRWHAMLEAQRTRHVRWALDVDPLNV